MPRRHRDLVIVNAEVDGRLVDVAASGGVITSIGKAASARRRGDVTTLDAAGAAVIPGLHDHHVHLAATAAARSSVDAGPPVVATSGELRNALRAADRRQPPGEWLRAVGYHESVAGDLDRAALDGMVPDRPARVQHRSGAVWFVNSAGLRLLGVDDSPNGAEPAGIEREPDGRATGRLFRLDEWLRERVSGTVPDLAPLGRELAAAGVVGCTDATPWRSVADLRRFADAVRAMPQRVLAMAAPGVADDAAVSVPIAATKVVLADHELPALADIEAWFTDSHARGRPVAVHAVTAEALALAIAAWNAAGVLDGDRVEHAAVTPASAVGELARLRVRVVTQPGFVRARGDSFLEDVPPAEHQDLWRCASLIAAGIRTAAGSDAPHGPIDPWRSIATAGDRTTPSGRILGADERLDPEPALHLWLSELADPGGPPRTVRVGAVADVCMLDRPLASVIESPAVDAVVATIVGGEIAYQR
jgi:predicted amidohydrolase YtcJ